MTEADINCSNTLLKLKKTTDKGFHESHKGKENKIPYNSKLKMKQSVLAEWI